MVRQNRETAPGAEHETATDEPHPIGAETAGAARWYRPGTPTLAEAGQTMLPGSERSRAIALQALVLHAIGAGFVGPEPSRDGSAVLRRLR